MLKLALEVSLVTLSEITRESKVTQVQAILDEVKVVEDELSCVTAFGTPESLIELSELSIGLPSSPIRIAFRFGKSLPDHSSLAVYNPKHTSSANKHGVVSHNRHHILLILIQNTMSKT